MRTWKTPYIFMVIEQRIQFLGLFKTFSESVRRICTLTFITARKSLRFMSHILLPVLYLNFFNYTIYPRGFGLLQILPLILLVNCTQIYFLYRLSNAFYDICVFKILISDLLLYN